MAILSESVVACQVYMGQLAPRRKVKARVDADTDQDVTHITQDVLDCPEHTEMIKLQGKVRNWLKANTLPSPIRGVYFVPVKAFVETDEQLDAYEAAIKVCAARLAAVLPELLKVGKARRRELFNEHDYPTPERVKEIYRLERRYLEISASGNLKEISEDVWNREQERIKNLWAEAGETIVTELRERFADAVGHLAERLRVGPDGRGQRFKASSVENVAEFCDNFAKLNVTNDTQLAVLVDQAKGLLNGVDAADLRAKGSESYRASLADSLGQIRSAMDPLLENRPRRALD
jgi:hypothetical protein